MSGLRQRLRRLGLGVATITGWRRRGWFIPYRYADRLAPAGTRRHYPAVEAQFRRAEPAFQQVLTAIERHGAALAAIGAEPPPAPRWTQSWFPRLDAAAAYALVREVQPARIVEIGSGHSTRFLARAVRDGSLATAITAVDPAPRAVLEGLPVALIRTTLQDLGPERLPALAAGDMLVVDSSHILMPGSDVDLLFGRVLPAAPPGLWLHLHDIFLPDDYPADWEWRGYNEQQGVLGLLLGGGFEVVFASHYVATRLADRLQRGVLATLPLVPGAVEASLWLRRR